MEAAVVPPAAVEAMIVVEVEDADIIAPYPPPAVPSPALVYPAEFSAGLFIIFEDFYSEFELLFLLF